MRVSYREITVPFLPPLRQLLLGIVTLSPLTVQAGDEFERPPIEYSQSLPENRISRLQSQLDGEESRLDYTARLGYLPAVLAALEVPSESQMLVFSKTSMQRQRISPRTPRALYFSDDVYVGFCQSGEVLEVSAVDPKLGTVFYTLDQSEQERPQFVRQTDNCMICHSSSRTENVPGHLVRSLFAGPSGEPILSAGSNMVDHTTPLDKRWGGWYVTGKHGTQKHLGNLIVRSQDVQQPVDNSEGQNVTSLDELLRVENYLTRHSDIVALMVFEHQTLVHNRIVRANFATRQALYYETELNRELGDPEGTRLDSTTRRIQSAGDDLIEALLLLDEAKLTAPISGTSNYAAIFSEMGTRDSQGRSLRDLDLERRIFKYPCSYLIYSPAFESLPSEMLDYVWKRLWDILANRQDAQKFAHLSTTDRRAIVEIIRDTKQELPIYWQTDPPPDF